MSITTGASGIHNHITLSGGPYTLQEFAVFVLTFNVLFNVDLVT